MGQALYRLYRPKSLADVVGQEHITSTILHALKQGKLAHAYLFTGPRGVGKTSIARILAHEINDLPYEDDAIHLDIIEIDAASNRRIDEIRELRDKVHITPTSAKYKVYIIDEVHMLTREAFNALLKTLEEPPAHAVFILATTESHKLPETIVSRTQRFIFKPVPLDKVVAHLRSIADQEKITISDEALELVAAHGEGSFRDSISLLDQTRGHDGNVDADYVRQLIGIPTDEAIDSLLAALRIADAAALSQTLTALRTQGFAAPQVAKHLGHRLRDDILAGKALPGSFELMEKLLEVPVAHEPDTYLDLVLLSHALAGQVPAAQPRPVAAAAPQPVAAAMTSPGPAVATPAAKAPAHIKPAEPVTAIAPLPVESVQAAAQPEAKSEAITEPDQKSDPAPSGRKPAAAVDENLWPSILESLRKSHNTLYGIARMAKPTFYEDALELAFTFEFHKKRLNENKNKEVVIGIIKQLTGKELALRCVMAAAGGGKSAAQPTTPPVAPIEQSTAPAVAAAAPANPEDLSAISNIFGGAEVLES